MEKLRILIIDDDAADLQALPQTVALHMKNMHIDTSDSATGALQQLQEHIYDAVVSDIKMPGMDGITLVEKLQSLSPETPTLLITAYGDRELAIRALRAGAYDFIEKPIDREYFVSSLQRAIQARQMRCQIAEQQQALECHAHQLERMVTERTQELAEANTALRQSRDAFRLLIEAMPQLVWTARPDGAWEYANQRWYEYTGNCAVLPLGDGWISCYHPDDQSKVVTLWKTSLLISQPFQVEARLREGKTGAYRWFLIRGVPLRNVHSRVWKWLGTCTDIHENKVLEDALRESDVRFRRLVQSNLLGIAVANLAGTIHEANDAFLDLVGYTQEDVAAGRVEWATITPSDYQVREAQAIEEMRTTGMIRPFEKVYVTKNGGRVPVLVGATRFHPPGSEPLVLCFILDLTAHKEIERQKDLMLSMTGHELKTPLAALKGNLQLLLRRVKRVSTSPDRFAEELPTFFHRLMECLLTCTRQVDVQTTLINDLLDVSRITAGTLKLDLELCDLASLARETVEDLRVTAPERSFLLERPAQPVVMVQADRTRISQVITNFITNAVRYSPADQPIHIGIGLQENAARVWVRDHGPGLTEEERAHLWQRFSQIKGVAVQCGSGKGLGLGLYICQTLIEQHQGEVGVESTPGDGSTFWFTLPIVTQGDLLRSRQNHAEVHV